MYTARFCERTCFMATSTSLPADPTAERIVRHFQSEGFPGITEALLVRVGVKKGDRTAIDAAFDVSVEQEVPPPVRDFFEIRLYGFYSEIRSLADAKARKYLAEQMEQHFFGTGAQEASGYKPTES